MRVRAGLLAIACLGLAGCRTPADAVHSQPTIAAVASNCPDGKAAQPGLTAFGAYIGTWQASHQRVPQTSEYVFAMDTTGRVVVRCSPTDYVVQESIDLKFLVPSGRALLFALIDLPSDSKQIFDHDHGSCRSLQYQSPELAGQLPKDDPSGLADITIGPPNDDSGASLRVTIGVGAVLGGDSKICQ